MKRLFWSGLIVLLPLLVTLWVLQFLVGLFTDPFVAIVSRLLDHLGLWKNGVLFFGREQIVHGVSKVLVLGFLFGFLLFLGLLAQSFFIKPLFRLWDRLLMKIPVVRSIYRSAQDITQTLLSEDGKSFQRVVLVQFPRAGSYVMGLVVKEDHSFEGVPARISVLVPTAPNPTSGFLLLVPVEETIPLDLTPDGAFKYILSCGVLQGKEAKQ